MKAQTVEEIKSWLFDVGIEKLKDNEYYALRADDSHDDANLYFDNSYNWPDGKKTTELPGTCAVELCGEWWSGAFPDVDLIFEKAWGAVQKYGSRIYLVKGTKHADSDCLANDEFNYEIILEDTEIICKIVTN
jgi:hypothetical protein